MKRYKNKLELTTLSLIDFELKENRSPWDKDGIFTFANKFNQFYIKEKAPEKMPNFGEWSTLPNQLKEISAFCSLERGILVSEKTLNIFKRFELPQCVIWKIKYKKVETYNFRKHKMETSGDYYLIFLYSSAINYINWSESEFYSHVYTEKDILIKDNLKFSSFNELRKIYPKSLYNEGIQISPKSIKLQKPYKMYDVFGVFFVNSDIIISDRMANELNRNKIFNRYNKIVPLDYSIEFPII